MKEDSAGPTPGSDSKGEDFQVILDVLSGNRNAYTVIVRKYEQKVRGYCRTALQDAVQADDAAQEIFLKAYQSLGSFKGNSSFSTWIYRIAFNHCTDLLRKRSRQKSESLEALIESEGEKIEIVLESPDTASAAEAQEITTALLAELPENYREILILREIEQLSYEEISICLEASLDTVKSRLKRARQELALKARHFLKVKGV